MRSSQFFPNCVFCLFKYLNADVTQIVAIASGSCTSHAIDNRGVAYAWGFGENHQLGAGSDDDILAPAVMASKSLTGAVVKAVCPLVVFFSMFFRSDHRNNHRVVACKPFCKMVHGNYMILTYCYFPDAHIV